MFFFHLCLPGCCRSPPLMIAGGRVFVIPCVQQIQRYIDGIILNSHVVVCLSEHSHSALCSAH